MKVFIFSAMSARSPKCPHLVNVAVNEADIGRAKEVKVQYVYLACNFFRILLCFTCDVNNSIMTISVLKHSLLNRVTWMRNLICYQQLIWFNLRLT